MVLFQTNTTLLGFYSNQTHPLVRFTIETNTPVGFSSNKRTLFWGGARPHAPLVRLRNTRTKGGGGCGGAWLASVVMTWVWCRGGRDDDVVGGDRGVMMMVMMAAAAVMGGVEVAARGGE
ncbi:hypothetical protein Tco_0453865 [Tanacetum coccineum]